MIRYFVGSDQFHVDKSSQFYMTLRDGLDCCPRYGYEKLENAEEERKNLLAEGYENVMIFKVEDV